MTNVFPPPVIFPSPEQKEKGRRLSWREACRLLGCSRSQFYNLVNAGRLPAFRLRGISRGLWVYETDCLKIIEKI